MFTVSAGYERFMGRWSRLLAPGYIAFAGVKNGDRVLDVGTGTGSLALAIEAAMPGSEIVGVDPSEVFVSSAQKKRQVRARAFRGRRWPGAEVQGWLLRQHSGAAGAELHSRSQQGDRRNAPRDPPARCGERVRLGLQRRNANAQILLGRSRGAGSGDRAEGRAPHEALPRRAARRGLEEDRTGERPGEAPGHRSGL